MSETSARLDDFGVVQPYEFVCRLPEGITEADIVRSPALDWRLSIGRKITGDQNIVGALFRSKLHGDSGFAWGARVDLLRHVKLYDKAVLGEGDIFVACGMLGMRPDESCLPTAAMQQDYYEWAHQAYSSFRGRLSYVPGDILHLWHGKPEDRYYENRKKILKICRFDPKRDLLRNDDECWELSPRCRMV